MTAAAAAVPGVSVGVLLQAGLWPSAAAAAAAARVVILVLGAVVVLRVAVTPGGMQLW
jgi:hypothetical protein